MGTIPVRVTLRIGGVRMDAAAAERLLREARRHWRGGSFLGGLGPADQLALVGRGQWAVFPRGTLLIREGEPASDVFLLLSSYVKVTAALAGGGRSLLAVRIGGDLVGELAGMAGVPRSASVIACGSEPVTAVRLAWGDFDEVKDARPAVQHRLQESVGRKLAAATRRRIDHNRRSPKGRLARVLVEMADDFGQSVRGHDVILPVDLKQVEWGDLIGVSESTAYRALRELRGLVDAQHRRIIVTDLPGLRTVAGTE
ncbi:Crp/Fnr family transcriptional regulator [Streptomyces sp. YU58]|uniref:Crp/Fnr family transcriptional regulator n=1 Tax=Streptomyces sp. SX92 TaxID=3158972 RepID=UPI0027B8D840|nr:Crp/Fnr family transcriptional regulator [Streptomyces coralus]WLW55969.1 Crp/Fnr family transcriptional regulator [Streptomyces coralus]